MIAKFSIFSGNKVLTAGKFPLISLEVTDRLFALKAIKSFSSDGLIEIETSPWFANVFVDKVLAVLLELRRRDLSKMLNLLELAA
jgi:hypothetical protein